MLTAQELRMGNYVEYFSKNPFEEWAYWWEMIQIDARDIVYIDTYSNTPDYRPIPITEDWLVKLGFGINKNAYIIKSKFLLKKVDSVNYEVKFWTDASSFAKNLLRIELNIKYIHQLQNLYFALTGRELTIKQTA